MRWVNGYFDCIGEVTMANQIEQEIVSSLRAGEKDGFEKLINCYSSKVYHLIERIVHRREDAEEVVQDVFITVYRKIADFEGKSSFSSWLYRIAVNAALMSNRKYLRISARFVTDQDAVMETQDEKNNYTLRNDFYNFISTVLDTMPIEYKKTFLLRDVLGYSSKEVALLLKVALPTVKSRLHRARLSIRQILKNKAVENSACFVYV